MALKEQRAWLRWVKARGFPLASRLFSRRASLPAGFAPERILVMQLQQIGDSVIFTPALRALRARFPSARIDMLVNKVSHQLYRKSPYVAQFWLTESWRAGKGGNRLRPLLPLMRQIRRERYDLVVSDISQQSFKYALIAALTGAKVRAGFNIDGHGFLNTLQVDYRSDASWLECNLDVARALGAHPPSAREELYWDDADARRVDEMLAGWAEPDAPIVAMHTGANWQSRLWYQERWAAVADHLVRSGTRVVFIGGPDDAQYVEGVRSHMREEAVSLAGRTDIPQLAALLSKASLFVGTDSGPRHMAGAVGTPHITVMSAQDDTNQWTGFREGETILRTSPECRGCFAPTCSHRTCMNLISVDDVTNACARALRLVQATRPRTAPAAAAP